MVLPNQNVMPHTQYKHGLICSCAIHVCGNVQPTIRLTEPSEFCGKQIRSHTTSSNLVHALQQCLIPFWLENEKPGRNTATLNRVCIVQYVISWPYKATVTDVLLPTNKSTFSYYKGLPPPRKNQQIIKYLIICLKYIHIIKT